MLLRDHLRTSGAGSEPIHRARFGQAVIAARNAALWVEKAAVMAEALDPGSVPVTLMARGVVEDAGLLLIDSVARSLGTCAFFTDHPADRIARDLGLICVRRCRIRPATGRRRRGWKKTPGGTILYGSRWRGVLSGVPASGASYRPRSLTQAWTLAVSRAASR